MNIKLLKKKSLYIYYWLIPNAIHSYTIPVVLENLKNVFTRTLWKAEILDTNGSNERLKVEFTVPVV